MGHCALEAQHCTVRHAGLCAPGMRVQVCARVRGRVGWLRCSALQRISSFTQGHQLPTGSNAQELHCWDWSGLEGPSAAQGADNPAANQPVLDLTLEGRLTGGNVLHGARHDGSV